MAHRSISDEEFLAKTFGLFRTYGYDGVSLKQLADATGLEKASLYYRYPGGKDQIALAVAHGLADWFQENIFDPLKGSEAPRKRLQLVITKLREVYGDGCESCVIDSLSLPGGPASLHAAIRQVVLDWQESFTALAKEAGLSSAASRFAAEDAILRIQGALILTRVRGDNAPFLRVLRSLPDLLLPS